MSWSQTRSPNLSTAGNIGYCLAFVEAAYATPHGMYSYAYQGWEGTVAKHEDQNFPEGMDVPIWFSYMVGSTNEGHVAIKLANGTILSSPWEQGTTQAVLPSIAELERIYSDNGVHPLIYLGWSEDLCGVQVVEYTAPAPVAPPFTIDVQPFSGQYTVNGNKWNLDLQDFAAIAASPVASAPITPVTFTAQLTRSDLPQYTYYLEDGNVHQGYNSLDCQPYVAPVVAAPYIPPTAPNKGTASETYTLLTTLPYYDSVTAVQNSNASVGTLPAKTYYVWSKAGVNNTYYNLTTDNSKNMNYWVNTLYNKAPVVRPMPPSATVAAVVNAPSITTAEIRASYRSIPDGPMDVSAKTNILVTDIVGPGTPITVAPGKPFHIYGTFRKNDQWYASPKINASDPEAANYLYGIPIASSTSLEPFLEPTYGYPEVLRYGISALASKIKGQFIDGFLWPKKVKK